MEENLWKQLDDNEGYKLFLREDFDVKKYANSVIQTTSIAEQLNHLVSGITLLDKELQQQVAAHHEDLLSQATGIEALDGVLDLMRTRIQSLQLAVERMRNKVLEPHKKIAERTAQLGRLQAACDLLRKILSILRFSKRLQGQLEGGVREIAKAAQSLNELDYFAQGIDLSGLEIIDQDQKFIRQARKEVERQAQNMLRQGMESQNQNQVATSLQVFHNLNCLLEVVEKVVAECRDNLHAGVKEALDIKQLSQQQNPLHGKGIPGRAAMPAPGNTAAFRANLWTSMERLMDQIYSTCRQVHHLQKVLAKKRDPVTFICFLGELSKDGQLSIMQSFWGAVTKILTEELSKSANESTFLKQAFEGEYPKLLRLYNELWQRLQSFSENMSFTTQSHDLSAAEEDKNIDLFSKSKSDDFNPEKMFKDSLLPFENAYLSRSLSRLFDPINLVFSGVTSPPSKEEVDNILKTISSELNVASVDAGLSIVVAKNVAKTIQLFTVKCEQMLCTDGEASQVIGPPTPGQTCNAGLVNTLHYLHQNISKIVLNMNNFPALALEPITSALDSILEQMKNAIEPMLTSISDAIEAIILTMHNEDFSGNATDGAGEAQCSLYMKELQGFISRVQKDYLLQFTCVDFIMNCIHPIACQTIDLFIRHASLLRPLGEGGKMHLAADFAQMELTITPLCKRVSDLGRHYRMLRSFRPLLFQTMEHVANSPAVGDIIPYSSALHYLFSKAPPDFRSPHKVAGWSLSKYSQWLGEHPKEKDRLTFIKATLEAYVQEVKQRHSQTFAPVYPVMLDLLQKALQVHG